MVERTLEKVFGEKKQNKLILFLKAPQEGSTSTQSWWE